MITLGGNGFAGGPFTRITLGGSGGREGSLTKTTLGGDGGDGMITTLGGDAGCGTVRYSILGTTTTFGGQFTSGDGTFTTSA
jgi:hypothetical protein